MLLHDKKGWRCILLSTSSQLLVASKNQARGLGTFQKPYKLFFSNCSFKSISKKEGANCQSASLAGYMEHLPHMPPFSGTVPSHLIEPYQGCHGSASIDFWLTVTSLQYPSPTMQELLSAFACPSQGSLVTKESSVPALTWRTWPGARTPLHVQHKANVATTPSSRTLSHNGHTSGGTLPLPQGLGGSPLTSKPNMTRTTCRHLEPAWFLQCSPSANSSGHPTSKDRTLTLLPRWFNRYPIRDSDSPVICPVIYSFLLSFLLICREKKLSWAFFITITSGRSVTPAAKWVLSWAMLMLQAISPSCSAMQVPHY